MNSYDLFGTKRGQCKVCTESDEPCLKYIRTSSEFCGFCGCPPRQHTREINNLNDVKPLHQEISKLTHPIHNPAASSIIQFSSEAFANLDDLQKSLINFLSILNDECQKYLLGLEVSSPSITSRKVQNAIRDFTAKNLPESNNHTVRTKFYSRLELILLRSYPNCLFGDSFLSPHRVRCLISKIAGCLRQRAYISLKQSNTSSAPFDIKPSDQPPADKPSSNSFQVDRVLNKKVVNGQTFYLLQWKCFSQSESTWEPADDCAHCADLISQFESSAEVGRHSALSRRSRSTTPLKDRPQTASSHANQEQTNQRRRRQSSNSKSSVKQLRKILGLVYSEGVAYFRVLWKGDAGDLDEEAVVDRDYLNCHYSLDVIKFYEENIRWDGETGGNKDCSNVQF